MSTTPPNQPLTIDQRLERLTERHEALTHSLELLAAMHKQTERELRRFMRLARHILIDHDERLSALEGEDEDQDKGERG